MIDKKPESFSDIVDRATEELRAMPVPPGPPELLDTLLKAASASDKQVSVASYNKPLSQLQKIRNIIMKNPFKSLTTFAACCLVLIAAYLIVGPLTHGDVALAEFSEIIQKAKTMVCTMRIITPLPGMDEKMHIRVMSIGPGRFRQEMGKDQVTITDYPAGKMLTLNSKGKFAVILNMKGVSNFMQQDWFSELKNMSQSSSVEELGLQTMNGKEVKGFRLKGNPAYTCWIDPKSGEPIKVEIKQHVPDFTNPEGKGEKNMELVMSDFQFDVPLEESMFSLTPPEGYKLQEMSMDLSNTNEKDVVELLRRYADMENGPFPDSLTDQSVILKITLEPMRRLEKKTKTQTDEKAAEKEMMKTLQEAGEVSGRMSKFLLENPGWKYAGKGIKLGDAQTPIFWYVPKNSKQGRVIYGDLSVRDVPADQLPPDPETKKSDTK
jgi:outer membrane lipoprotein-sorting protein